MAEENKKNKVDISKKDGVAYLKELGLKEVSDKTFINIDNLQALLNKGFENINKTKALGFIQILQREFSVDLSALKNEYLQFDNDQRKIPIEEEVDAPVSSMTSIEKEEPKKILRYVLLGLLALGAVYYLFSGSDESTRTTSMDLNVVKNEVFTEEAKESLLTMDESYEREVNESDDIDLNKVVEEMFKHDSNASEETLVLEESNNSIESTKVTEKTIDDNSSVMQSALMAPAKEEDISLADIQEDPTPEVVLAKVEKPKPPVKKATPKKVIHNKQQSGFYIDPVQKAWVGVIYLDTMKKKDYLIRNRLKLDASQDQIILVGHKNFKIFNHKLEQGFKSKKMVRFLYRDGELSELSKQEYLDYLGNTHW